MMINLVKWLSTYTLQGMSADINILFLSSIMTWFVACPNLIVNGVYIICTRSKIRKNLFSILIVTICILIIIFDYLYSEAYFKVHQK